jgi:pilus assembly protein FimV
MYNDNGKILKHIQRGNLKGAIEEYQKVIASEPKNYPAINALGDLYVRTEQPAEAIKHFLFLAEKYRTDGFAVKAIAMYKKIMKLEPSNDQASLKLAELYDEQKRTVDARQQYQMVANSLESKGQIQLALKIMKQIAHLDPNNVELKLELAARYQVEAFPEEAHQTYLQTGELLFDKGRVEESIEVFKKALQINPTSKTAIALLVKIFTREGGVRP